MYTGLHHSSSDTILSSLSNEDDEDSDKETKETKNNFNKIIQYLKNLFSNKN